MDQRLHAVVLVVLLAVGQPLQAAEHGRTLRVRVNVAGASAEQTEALCAAARRAGGEVKLISTASGWSLEVVAGRANLAAIMKALRAAAEAQGVNVEIPSAPGEAELLAEPLKSGTSLRASRPSAPAVAGGRDFLTPRLCSSAPGRIDRWLPPPLRASAGLPACARRGPPA